LKIRVLDRRGWRLEIRPESEEDLWVLRNTLRPGDLVTGKTLRDVSIKGGEARRRPIVVTMRLKYADFQAFTGKLRLYGIIVEGPEEYGLKGKHHAMTVSPGQSIIVEREGGWDPRVLEKLKSSGPRGKAIVAAVDYDEYAVAVIAPHGYRVAFEASASLPGKDDPSRDQALERYVEKVARDVLDQASQERARVVVIAGPGPLKEMVAGKLKEMASSLHIYLDSTSMGGRAGIEEALRRPVVREALQEYSMVQAESWLEELMKVAARDPDRVAFGVERVREAARLGAVDKLIVIDELLYTIEDEVREAVDEALLEAERKRGLVLIVPADSPVGERLRLMGGIAALLRFPLPSSP
jgi:protein pelota